MQIDHPPPAAVKVESGESLSIICEGFGRPPPELQWFVNGMPLRNKEESEVSPYRIEDLQTSHEKSLQTALTKSRLNIGCVDASMAGIYSCSAYNTGKLGRMEKRVETTVTVNQKGMTSSAA